MTAPCLQPLHGGQWLLRLREWDSHEHEDVPGAPPLLDGDRATRQQIDALEATGGIRIALLRGGFRVETRSLVGRVRVGSLTVLVTPKIADAPMTGLLRYAYHLRGVFDRAEHRASTFGFDDLVALELAAEVSSLATRGLVRRYAALAEELPAPRGRIEFQRLARGDRTSASLPCRHHIRSLDTPIHRALLMGLTLARRVSRDGGVRARLHRVRELFDEVAEPLPGRDVLQRATRLLDRTTAAYGPALRLVELLMDGAGVVLAEGHPVSLRGFLFDMNVLFQKVLGRFLREDLVDGAVLEERPLHGMLSWDPACNPQGLLDPLPRPDFAIRLPDGSVELLDAKYQELCSRAPSPEVTYQLAMYALSPEGRGRATILHPGKRTDREQALVIRTALRGEGQARIVLRPVDLGYLHELLTAGRPRDRTGYARRLVFGEVPRR